MAEQNPYLQQLRRSPGMRLAVLFCAFFLFLSLTSVSAAGIDLLPFGSERDKGLAASALQSIFAFFLPAYILGRFASDSSLRWLGCSRLSGLLPFVGVVIVYLLSLPAMEWLINWNQNLHLPSDMKGLEDTFRQWEENNGAISAMLLDTHNAGGIISGVLIIGLLTGFSEEIFFRGALQGIFQRSALGKNAGVWLAAFIFSALHFQFFGFVPRLIMGAFFGYLFFWTRSLWVPVFAHALNNSAVVLVTAFSGNPATIDSETVLPSISSVPNLLPLASLVSTTLFLLFFRGYFFKSHNIWQRKQQRPVTGS